MKKTIIFILCLICLLFTSCTIITSNEENKKTDDINLIDTVIFDFDTKNYELSYSSNLYEASYIKDPNYNYINVVITANEGYRFSSSVKLIVNGIESTEFSISSDLKQIEYKTKDPNWTPFY